jgi:signal peptidase I
MNFDRQSYNDTLTPLSKVILTVAGILVGIAIVRLFLMPFTVSDRSMAPGLNPGDRVYVLKHFSATTGDVVVVKSPVEPDRVLLTRIVAREGDSVEIKNKTVFINGNPADFRWKTMSTDTRIFPMSFSYRDNYPVIKLKRRQIFVLGDNYDSSMDSRFFGPLDEDLLVGKVVYKF